MIRTCGAVFLVCALVAFLAPSDAAAQNGERSGFSIGLGLGPSVVPNPDDEGVVLKIMPGWEVVDGVDIEFETGFKRGQSDGERFGMWPFLLGVRYSFPDGPVVPFAGVHVGPAISLIHDGYDWYAESQMVGFSVGGGVDYMLSENYGVGSELSYSYFTPTDGYNPTTYHFVDLTIEIRLGF